MRREDWAAELIEVWPDNWRSIEVFSSLGSQWRYGATGPTGLDYAAIIHVFRFLRIPRADWKDIFEDIQVMELEAMRTMRGTKT